MNDPINKSTILIQAIIKNYDLEVIKAMVEIGADVNLPDENYSSTPLLHACQKSRIDIVKYLLESGADVNYKSLSKGWNDAVDFTKNLKILRLLFEYNYSNKIKLIYDIMNNYENDAEASNLIVMILNKLRKDKLNLPKETVPSTVVEYPDKLIDDESESESETEDEYEIN